MTHAERQEMLIFMQGVRFAKGAVKGETYNS